MKKNANNIILIGPMGAGKTCIGKALSQITHYTLIDSDHEIETRTGVDIPWIFEVEGEAGFRQREASIIGELVKMNGIILSVGGGAITFEETRRCLALNGIVIYLRVSIQKQMQRIMTSKHNRPMLKTHNTEEKLGQLNDSREKFYEEIADLTYETDHFKPNELAELIATDVKKIY